MNDDRSLERAARSWIEAGPTRAPESAVAAALQLIETTSQERDLRIPWRTPRMNRFALAGAAVALLVVVAVGGSLGLGWLPIVAPPGSTGTPGPSQPSPTVSSPTITDSPSPPSSTTMPVTTGRFVPAGSLVEGRAYHSALALQDGRVLVVGGEASHSRSSRGFLDSIEIWDPASNEFTASGGMQRVTWGDQVEGPSLFRMVDGRTLLVPTGCECRSPGTTPAQVWDPVSGAKPLENVLVRGNGFTTIQLSSGGILVAGGVVDPVYDANTAAEVWDPIADAIEPTGPLGHARIDAVATLLKDGRVLILGGFDRVGGDLDYVDVAVPEAEIWNPASGTFSTAFTFEIGPGPSVRRGHRVSALTLLDGRVLVVDEAGGRVWDPVANTLSEAGTFRETRREFTATLLADGRVLVAGGKQTVPDGGGSPTASTELWDPSTSRFEPGPELAEARAGHTATLLADGRVLIVGGYRAGSGLDGVLLAELWEPVPGP